MELKSAFENLLKLIAEMPDNKQKFAMIQLNAISAEINRLHLVNEKQRQKITGVKEENYTDVLERAIDVMILFGFNEFTFMGLNPKFMDWFFRNTSTNPNFNPKLMNWYLLTSMEQAYYLTEIDGENEEPEFNLVKHTLKTFVDENNAYKAMTKEDLLTTLNRCDGTN